MSKSDAYRTKLGTLSHWDAYLLKELGLPGPRGNIELAQVVADEGRPELFHRYLTYTADRAPTNSPYEFLAFCGVVGLGRTPGRRRPRRPADAAGIRWRSALAPARSGRHGSAAPGGCRYGALAFGDA